MASTAAWTGPVERYIRKIVTRRGERAWLLQMGSRGRGKRRAYVCRSLEEAREMKARWLADGIPPAREQPIRVQIRTGQALALNLEVISAASIDLVTATLRELFGQKEARP